MAPTWSGGAARLGKTERVCQVEEEEEDNDDDDDEEEQQQQQQQQHHHHHKNNSKNHNETKNLNTRRTQTSKRYDMKKW